MIKSTGRRSLSGVQRNFVATLFRSHSQKPPHRAAGPSFRPPCSFRGPPHSAPRLKLPAPCSPVLAPSPRLLASVPWLLGLLASRSRWWWLPLGCPLLGSWIKLPAFGVPKWGQSRLASRTAPDSGASSMQPLGIRMPPRGIGAKRHGVWEAGSGCFLGRLWEGRKAAAGRETPGGGSGETESALVH